MVVCGVWEFPRKNKAGLQSSRERGRGEGVVIFYFCLFLPRFSYLFHFCYFYIFTFYILLVKTRPVWRREGEGGAVASQLAHGSSMASELMTWAGTIDQPTLWRNDLWSGRSCFVYSKFCGPVGCRLKERFFHKRNIQIYIGMQLYHLYLPFHEAKENISFDENVTIIYVLQIQKILICNVSFRDALLLCPHSPQLVKTPSRRSFKVYEILAWMGLRWSR